jgi:hypothetical protein
MMHCQKHMKLLIGIRCYLGQYVKVALLEVLFSNVTITSQPCAILVTRTSFNPELDWGGTKDKVILLLLFVPSIRSANDVGRILFYFWISNSIINTSVHGVSLNEGGNSS